MRLPAYRLGNAFSTSQVSLSKDEQKVLAVIYSRKKDESSIAIKELARLCHWFGHDIYGRAKRIFKKLKRKFITLSMPNQRYETTYLFQKVTYRQGEGRIDYVLDPKVKAETMDATSAYLSIPREAMMVYNSKYSMRFYPLLRRMIKIQSFEHSLENLADMFCLGNTYRGGRIYNMKKRVIEPAIREINEKSDIQVKYEYVKEGRQTKKIAFHVFLKTKNYKPIVKNKAKATQALNAEEQALCDRLLKAPWNLTPKVATSLIQTWGMQRVQNNLRYARNYADRKDNPAGWLVYCIKKDFGGELAKADAVRKKEKAEQRKFVEKQESRPQREAPSYVHDFMKVLRRGETMDEEALAKLMNKNAPPAKAEDKSAPLPSETQEEKKNARAKTLQDIISSLANKLSI